MTKLDFIKMFIELGISIIPLYHRSKEPMLPTWREFQSRLPTDTEYKTWFPTDWNNYGVVAGWTNLVILDFDSMFYFELWHDHMVANGMEQIFDSMFKVVTSHGLHVYVRTIDRAANDKRISISGGIDVQAQGKYVVGSGCVHPSGTQYVPVGELRLVEVDSIATILPEELFPRVRADEVVYSGEAATFATNNTEYHSTDAFSLASCDSVDLITKIKRSVRIESLFPGAQRSSTDGRWLKALCPFHKDTHESFWIDTRRQLCGCQVCGMRPMDAINLFSRMHNVSESVAVSRLAEDIGVWR